jgi:hypothetical protein
VFHRSSDCTSNVGNFGRLHANQRTGNPSPWHGRGTHLPQWDRVADPEAANHPAVSFSANGSFFSFLPFYYLLLLRKSRQQCQRDWFVRADAPYDLFELSGFVLGVRLPALS